MFTLLIFESLSEILHISHEFPRLFVRSIILRHTTYSTTMEPYRYKVKNFHHLPDLREVPHTIVIGPFPRNLALQCPHFFRQLHEVIMELVESSEMVCLIGLVISTLILVHMLPTTTARTGYTSP